MRYPIYGVVVASSDITVYDPGTTTAATIYAAASGGSALAGGVVTADAYGRVVFFYDSADYSALSYFDILSSGTVHGGIWSFFTAVGSDVTVLGIYNLALTAIGASRMASVSESTVQATVVKEWYSTCRDTLLRSHPWNFAEKRASLTAVVGTTPTMDYARFFDLPIDCLKLRKLSDEAVDVPYKVEGRRIACDEATISILYTYRITDPAYFDPIFVDCLVAMLAWKISYPIKSSLALTKQKEADFRTAFANAVGTDAQEGTPDQQYCDDLLVVR